MKFGGIFTKTFVGALALTFFVLPAQAGAQLTHNFIGLSPSSVSGKDLLRDRVVEKTVNLQRDLSDLPVTLQATFSGEDARFLRGPEFVEFAVGQTATTYTFEIAPEGAPTGTYEATIDFLPVEAADNPTGTGFGIRRGVTLKVDFSVTDKEVLEYSVLHSELRQTEVGLPFYFTYTLDNTGNVEWRPDRVVFSFSDAFTDQFIEEIELSGTELDFAAPGNITTIQSEVRHELLPSNYGVEMMFYEGEDIVHIGTGSLVVFEAGTLEQQAQIRSLITNKLVYKAGENIKVTGTFKNIGDIPTVGTMVTEVYSATGELVDILTSDPREASPGMDVEIDQILKLREGGEYRIDARVEYAVTKVTAVASATIQVEDGVLGGNLNILPFVLLIIATIILLGAVIVYFVQGKKRKKLSVGVVPPQSAQPMEQPASVSAQPTGQSTNTSVQPMATPVQTPPKTAPKEVPPTVPTEEVKKPEIKTPPPAAPVAAPPSPKPAKSPPVEKTPSPTVPKDVSEDDDMWTISL